jgi:hypothetical protein
MAAANISGSTAAVQFNEQTGRFHVPQLQLTHPHPYPHPSSQQQHQHASSAVALSEQDEAAHSLLGFFTQLERNASQEDLVGFFQDIQKTAEKRSPKAVTAFNRGGTASAPALASVSVPSSASAQEDGLN